jgi:HEAT repeat protein
MADLSEELRAALEAEESGELVQLLGRRRPEDFAALRELLLFDASIPTDFRMKAMFALGRWGDPSVIPDIIRLLPDLGERERISALAALGHLARPEAVPAILEFADDASPQVRKAAALALSRISTPEATAKLKDIAAKDPVSWIRDLAARRAR